MQGCAVQLAALLSAIQTFAPLEAAAEWDNSGMQVSGGKNDVSRVAVLLDPTPSAVRNALEWKADFILSHHPAAFKPQPLGAPTPYTGLVRLLFRADCALYSAHTSLDANPAGPAGWLAEPLGIRIEGVLEQTWTQENLAVHLDHNEADALKSALPAWRSLKGMTGAFFEADGLTFLVQPDAWPDVRAELEPHLPRPLSARVRACAYGFGWIGSLETPLPATEFIRALRQAVACGHILAAGEPPARVRRVAVCPGSGSSLIRQACQEGADVLITGDVKYHAALDAPLFVLDVGHFSLEEEMMRRFCQLLRDRCPDAEFRFFPYSDPLRLLTGENK